MNMRYVFLLGICGTLACSISAMQDMQKAKALIVLMDNIQQHGKTDDELGKEYKSPELVEECRDILKLQEELSKRENIEDDQKKLHLIQYYLKNTQEDGRDTVCELMKTVKIGENLIERARQQNKEDEQPVFEIGHDTEKEGYQSKHFVDLNNISIDMPPVDPTDEEKLTEMVLGGMSQKEYERVFEESMNEALKNKK